MLHWTFCYRNTTTSLCIRWSQFFCPKKIHVIGEVERQFPKERALRSQTDGVPPGRQREGDQCI